MSSTATPRPAPTGHGPVLEIEATADGFAVPEPDPRPAGPVVFRVSTPDEDGHKWGVFALRGTSSLESFLEDLVRSFSWDPAVKAEGSAGVNRQGRLLGGVNVYAEYPPHEFRAVLTEGTYYFLDYDDVVRPCLADRVRALRVTGRADTDPAPAGGVDAVIEAVGEGAGERYEMPDELPCRGRALLRNHNDHPQEAVFGRLLPGTTDEELVAWMEAYKSGGKPDKDVFTGSPSGFMPVSGGEQAVIGYDLPPGPYAVFSFSRNPVTGAPGAFGGMRKIVTLRQGPGPLTGRTPSA